MKKHEKDLTEFCSPVMVGQLHRCLGAILLFIGLSVPPLWGQEPCDPEAQFTVTIVGTNLIATAAMPNPNAVFTWTWSDGNGNNGTSTGTALTIPLNFSQDNSYK